MLDNFRKNSQIECIDLESPKKEPMKILVLFGTRPEIIKLAPVIFELKERRVQTVVVSSSQHTDLLAPFLRIFDLEVDHDLRVMRKNQTPTAAAARILSSFDKILEIEKPDVVLVQGDTTTAFAGAFAAFNRRIKVGHVEAGLRSGNPVSPFPEEMNRRMISQIADFHFCATELNRQNLLAENVVEKQIFVSGNTVVDALFFILESFKPGSNITNLINNTLNLKRILLTTHRRESFGETMGENLKTLRDFVADHEDVCLIFPVHPNPQVRSVTKRILSNRKNIYLLDPLDYIDFVYLMKNAWLIISDSGGVQEESPSLGKPLFILRENTERPEAIAAGAAKLVGVNSLEEMLETNYNNKAWIESVKQITNPFGDGSAAKKIVGILEQELSAPANLKLNSKQP